MKIKTILFAASLMLAAVDLPGQNININEPPAVAAMMDKFEARSRAKPEVEGWRIQLIATTDRQKVEDEKRRFQSLYPNIRADWVHSKPYYKLQAGAFATRLEALRMLKYLRRDFPGAYPAMDKIKPEELF